MSIWNKIFCVTCAVIFTAAHIYPIAAQTTSRVDHYTVTPFIATWTDISGTGDTFRYSLIDEGHGTITMPFDFPYDDSMVKAGSKIEIGASGCISLSQDTTPFAEELDSASHPGLVCVFNGLVVEGTGHAVPSDSDFYEVDGIAPNRVLTVQYHFMHMPGTGSGGGGGGGGGGAGGNANMIQVKFYETSGVIEFIYQTHKSPFEPQPAILCGIGLNGFSTPKFVAYVYDSNMTASPDSDVRWTPGSSAVVEGSELPGFSFGSFYPNPANSAAHASLTIPTDETVRLDIDDASGALVQSTSIGSLAAGDHTIEIDTKNLPCGTYYCTVSCAGARITRQAVILR